MVKRKNTASIKSQHKADNNNNEKPKSYGTESINFEKETKPAITIDSSTKETNNIKSS